jgi:hypothetical protein
MATKTVFKIPLSAYEIQWIEQAKDREDRGQTLDDGVLITLGNLLLSNLEL